MRKNSAQVVQADLCVHSELLALAAKASEAWDGVSALINNASAFYRTPFGSISEAQWDELFGSNLKGPFFLSQALAPILIAHQGCIVNLVDIHAERGLPDYAAYSVAKAGLVAMTKILAKELAPNVRVNAVAPGAILWPESGLSAQEQQVILQKIPLARQGACEDVAKAVGFLVNEANYTTGQILNVDGGRLLSS